MLLFLLFVGWKNDLIYGAIIILKSSFCNSIQRRVWAWLEDLCGFLTSNKEKTSRLWLRMAGPKSQGTWNVGEFLVPEQGTGTKRNFILKTEGSSFQYVAWRWRNEKVVGWRNQVRWAKNKRGTHRINASSDEQRCCSFVAHRHHAPRCLRQRTPPPSSRGEGCTASRRSIYKNSRQNPWHI